MTLLLRLRPPFVLLLLLLLLLITQCPSFVLVPKRRRCSGCRRSSIRNNVILCSSSSTYDSDTVPLNTKDLDDLKDELVRICSTASPKPGLDIVRSLAQQVEQAGEQLGIGQSSSSSGLLSGEWKLLYSPQDVTRSSPFFWAFRRAFPDQSDEIFSITDAIPSPIKEVGPAYQEINLSNSTFTGTLISRVKVTTLGGMASSIMTTRATIVDVDGLDGVRLKIETTKPEDSTVIKTLFGPLLGDVVNDNLPPFPSGDALERAKPGSSEVTMRTTYCDEDLRISQNDDDRSGVYVWQRTKFAVFESL